MKHLLQMKVLPQLKRRVKKEKKVHLRRRLSKTTFSLHLDISMSKRLLESLRCTFIRFQDLELSWLYHWFTILALLKKLWTMLLLTSLMSKKEKKSKRSLN